LRASFPVPVNKTKGLDILRRNESSQKGYPLEIALHEAVSLKKRTKAIYKLKWMSRFLDKINYQGAEKMKWH